MRFSERIGLTKVKVELEREAVSDELRNALWSVFRERLYDPLENSNWLTRSTQLSQKANFARSIWLHFFKKPIDELPISTSGYLHEPSTINGIRDWYFEAPWYKVLDFIEFVNAVKSVFELEFNHYLFRERSAYRFIEGKICEINSAEEVIEIENALRSNSSKFKSVHQHLKSALDLYGDRQNPNFRNSIKESISAVEALGKVITQNPKATLGQALKEIEKKHAIPNSLKSAFDKLYGYSSNEGGIRHALTDEGVTVTMAEARFMLVTCSAFVNYLIAKNYS